MTRVIAQGSELEIATKSPTPVRRRSLAPVRRAPSAPVYRIAALPDLVDVAKVEKERFGKQCYPYFALRQLFELHGNNWLIAEVDGSVRGHVLVAFTPDRRAWLLSLAVTKGSCGRGYGSNLLEQAIELCRKRGVRSVLITVRPTNQSAYNLYNRIGFQLTASEETYFGVGEPRDILEYRLQP